MHGFAYSNHAQNKFQNMSVFADMTTLSEVDNLVTTGPTRGCSTLRQGDEAGRGAGAAVAQFPPNHERFMLLRRYILITCLGKSNAVDS